MMFIQNVGVHGPVGIPYDSTLRPSYNLRPPVESRISVPGFRLIRNIADAPTACRHAKPG